VEKQNIDTSILSAYRKHSYLRRRAGVCRRQQSILVTERTKIADRARRAPPIIADDGRHWRVRRRTRSLWKLRHNRADYSRRSTACARYDLSFSFSPSHPLSLSLSFSRSSSWTARIKLVARRSADFWLPVKAGLHHSRLARRRLFFSRMKCRLIRMQFQDPRHVMRN